MTDDVDAEQPKGRRREEVDDDDDLDLDDDEQNDDEQDPDEGKSEADLRAELKRQRAAAAKLSKQGGRRAGALKEARKRIAELEGKTDDDAEDDDDADESKAGQQARKSAEGKGLTQKDVERAVRKAEEKVRRELEAERNRDRITSRAETALLTAGASEKTAKLLLTRIDHDDLTLEKDGTVDGLEEAIDDLKTDYPELFASKRRRGERINGGDDREGGRGKEKPLSASERQARMVNGR